LFTIDLIAMIVFSVAQFWVTDAVWLIIFRLLLGVAVAWSTRRAVPIAADGRKVDRILRRSRESAARRQITPRDGSCRS
jgi:hypothetical protein